MKKILLIDDSALMRRIICGIINADNRLRIEDTAADGLEGLELLQKKTYDLVLLDMIMPRMDGIAFLKEYGRLNMSTKVILVSTTAGEGKAGTIEALSLGAVDFVKKPDDITGMSRDKFQKHLIQVVHSVLLDDIRKTPYAPMGGLLSKPQIKTGILPSAGSKKAVAIASSTGGPKALMDVLPYLPFELDAPVFLVQHMPAGFTQSLASRLDTVCDMHVVEADDGMAVQKGTIYIAKGGYHMGVECKAGIHRIRIYDGPNREGVKPCANNLYESLAKTNYDHITCVVLTGMGADGTEGILNLKKEKPVYVITQTQETCAVYGMPRCADMAGLTDEKRPLPQIAEAILKNVGVKKDGC